jgi:pseudouridine-5'-phosphate glycosidase
MRSKTDYLFISEDIQYALLKNQPIIALESTIIAHGMPYPQNMELAKRLEQICADEGVTPATICLMDGKIKVGLSEEELETLAKSDNVAKVSRGNFAAVLASKKTGATTVAATMFAAHLANIETFATGGIGGVHRFAEETFDISADLQEFARTPVIVVSAGAKAILDLPKTLEYLETLGVPVYGYQTDYFPAFYSAETDLKIERIDSIQEIVEIYSTGRSLEFTNGILVANPIPKEHEIPFDVMNEHIEQAIRDAKAQNITGEKVTPFLLAKLVEITDGKSLEANIKLVENNVRLACEIAKVV